MAKIQIRADGNPGAILAERNIPDAAIPSIRRHFGGTTADETAEAVISFIIATLKREGEEAEIKAERQELNETWNATETTTRTNFRTNIWP